MSLFSRPSSGRTSSGSPPPATVEELVAQGTTLARQGDFAGAIRYFDGAISLRPAVADTWIRKGNAYRELGDDTGAIRCYDEGILLRPGISAPWTLKGNVLMDQGRYRGAIECYDEALEIQPGNLLAGRHRDEAMAVLRRSMTVEEWIGWGLSHFERGRYARANECYDVALELDPTNPVALKQKASVLARQETAPDVEGEDGAAAPDRDRE